MKKSIYLLLFCLLNTGLSFAQQAPSFSPKLDGVLKIRSEWDTENGDFRMAVRNARFGARGMISDDIGYRVQMDLSNNGTFSILDAYITYKWDKTSFRIGQQHYQFSSDVMRGPSDGPFANRSFVGKYITSYAKPVNGDFAALNDFDTESIGSRDVGITMWQEFRLFDMNCTAIGGIMNGAGANKATWRNSPNYVARLVFGDLKGFQAVTGVYVGEIENGVYEEGSNLPKRFDMFMGNLEARYIGKNYRIDAEVAIEHVDYNRSTPDIINKRTVAGSIFGYYRFDTKLKRLTYWMPVLRFDFGRALDFHNLLTEKHDRANVERITAGVNIGLHPVFNKSELRFQYEKYCFDRRPTDHSVNALFNDKFTIEFCTLF